MEQSLILAVLFFFIAALYSSVGFGGGSSYLAIMYLVGVDLFLLRSTALMCNIIVVSGGTYLFIKAGYLRFKEALTIAALSIPMAFAGGYLPLGENYIFITLGTALLTASILLWLKKPLGDNPEKKHKSLRKASAVGGGIGFLSGLVGIGGGIFLSPFLHIIRWDRAKYIAALASFFILVNSMAGLAGQWIQNNVHVDLSWSWPLLVAVFLGGQIGSRLAIRQFNHVTVRRITAVVIMIAAMKILNDHLFDLI
ncbi:MAG: sulfite exporter TauE/SafE family protein [Fulvivirga sp.]|nr:sulfite exporter TauE/SafE family protein [Fulvivirga sp.]